MKLTKIELKKLIKEEIKSGRVNFDLDIVASNKELLIDIEKITKMKCYIIKFTYKGPGGNQPNVEISAPSKQIAFKVVDMLYGPDDGSRESNEFYVFGE